MFQNALYWRYLVCQHKTIFPANVQLIWRKDVEKHKLIRKNYFVAFLIWEIMWIIYESQNAIWVAHTPAK